MQTLIIDHYDSFTYNLFQLVAQIEAQEPIVIAHDSPELAKLNPLHYDNIILSPGPGHPNNPQDFKTGKSVILNNNKPILGVCLGHQGIFAALGGRVESAPAPMHGCLSKITHTDDELYQGIPKSFQVMRYHSLICSGPVPKDLEITAWTADGLIMGLRHKYKPIWGVQYHPESIACEYGKQLLANFQKLSRKFSPSSHLTSAAIPKVANSSIHYAPQFICGTHDGAPSLGPADKLQDIEETKTSQYGPQSWKLLVEKLPFFPDSSAVFKQIFSHQSSAVWLDSSQIIPGFSRFSYMGGIDSHFSYHLAYDVNTQITTKIQQGKTTQYASSIFDFLKQAIHNIEILRPDSIPFDFLGGFIGYFGYELNQETAPITNAKRSSHPDAQWLFLDRFIVFDHQEQNCYLVALTPSDEIESQETWLQTMSATIQSMQEYYPSDDSLNYSSQGQWIQPKDVYLNRIQDCLNLLAAGETYEICLTNKLRFAGSVDPCNFYFKLRQSHPAPHAAFLKFSDLSIACSSMERFLKINAERQVQTKPIKGTMPRGRNHAEDHKFALALQTQEKFHSEHVMIVDLLRNDLGKICEIGTVSVPNFMQVETYATLHQLVTLLTGQLKPEVNSIECIQHIFPGGSMTGAPKIRTMSLLNELETEARGIYSGSLGYISLDGALDLNIIIRTAEITPYEISIGAGGAIIALSDSEDEFAEMVLKTRALQRVLGVTK